MVMVVVVVEVVVEVVVVVAVAVAVAVVVVVVVVAIIVAVGRHLILFGFSGCCVFLDPRLLGQPWLQADMLYAYFVCFF